MSNTNNGLYQPQFCYRVVNNRNNNGKRIFIFYFSKISFIHKIQNCTRTSQHLTCLHFNNVRFFLHGLSVRVGLLRCHWPWSNFSWQKVFALWTKYLIGCWDCSNIWSNICPYKTQVWCERNCGVRRPVGFEIFRRSMADKLQVFKFAWEVFLWSWKE
jgi:hypothetical protein